MNSQITRYIRWGPECRSFCLRILGLACGWLIICQPGSSLKLLLCGFYLKDCGYLWEQLWNWDGFRGLFKDAVIFYLKWGGQVHGPYFYCYSKLYIFYKCTHIYTSITYIHLYIERICINIHINIHMYMHAHTYIISTIYTVFFKFWRTIKPQEICLYFIWKRQKY